MDVAHRAVEVATALDEAVDAFYDAGVVAPRHIGEYVGNLPVGREPIDSDYVLDRKFGPAKRNHLVENALGVAHAAVCEAGYRAYGAVGGLYLLFGGYFRQVFCDKLFRYRAEFKALAARCYRAQNLVRLGGGENEFDVLRRLFERFEEGVEGVGSQRVDFVYYVYFIGALRGGVLAVLAQLSDFVYRAVRRPVYFNDIHAGAVHYRLRYFIVVGRMYVRAAPGVESLGEQARNGGFARAARPHEEICVADSAGLYGVGERAHNVLLPDEFGKLLWAVPARYYLITFAHSLQTYRRRRRTQVFFAPKYC